MRKLFLILSLIVSASVAAQKKPLDHSVYDAWQSVTNQAITKSGKYISYVIRPQEGDAKLYIRSQKDGREYIVERGDSLRFTKDERFAICRVKPLFADTRQARIDKKKADQMPKDSLLLLSLADGKRQMWGKVSSFRMGGDDASSFAFVTNDSTLLVMTLPEMTCDTLKKVDAYVFNEQGTQLAYTLKDKKKQKGVGVYDVKAKTHTVIADEYAFYTLPIFSKQGDKLLFLASTDTLKTGSKHCDVLAFNVGDEKARVKASRPSETRLQKGWGITEYSKPYFSNDGERIFLGVQPLIAPDDTTIIWYDTPQLDIWSYNQPTTPPYEKKNLKELKQRTCLATLHSDGTVLPFSTSFYDRISLMDEGRGKYALSVDQTDHMVEYQWNHQLPQKVSLVDIGTGVRTLVSEGVYTHVTASPDGKYLIWYNLEERQWYMHDIAANATHCLTIDCGANFWNEREDTPSLPYPYGVAGWTEGDKELWLYDAYDIWRFPTDGGKASCLTMGEGRKTDCTYRYEDLTDKGSLYGRGEVGPIRKKRTINPEETIILSVFDNNTKEYGYATSKPAKNAAPTVNVKGGYKYSQLLRAQEATDQLIYTKENFNCSPDLYATSSLWKKENRITAINPQQADYLWGTAELFHWNAFDGTPLVGLLYKPENFDENKKYPVMMYFYERRSENLYSYYAPAPSRSTINISFYCSRGYVVLVPDIVYKAGIPGECAYNCIVSGAEALAKNKWIDRDRMAIQGQSWGGYQTAYLVTRTNLFRAAGSGAPVANMASAYGGIRWESGLSRQYQYEHTQSRIGRTLWEAPELYIANSPVFKLDRVETPILIMHNDADGAVPWYQGIELFMGLRRLGKPAWLLEYNDEQHNLTQRKNRKDLTIRLQQFFDYYLKDAPQPAWMKSGIPILRKGQYFGYEDAE